MSMVGSIKTHFGFWGFSYTWTNTRLCLVAMHFNKGITCFNHSVMEIPTASLKHQMSQEKFNPNSFPSLLDVCQLLFLDPPHDNIKRQSLGGFINGLNCIVPGTSKRKSVCRVISLNIQANSKCG
jgi:hypothetical protein